MLAFLAALAQPQELLTPSKVKNDLLDGLAADGFLTPEQAAQARAKYVRPEDDRPLLEQLAGLHAQSRWTRYLSLMNVAKLVAVGLFLFVFAGVIHKISHGVWKLIRYVPTWLYQAAVLSYTVWGTVQPKNFTKSESLMLLHFCSLANLVVLSWVGLVYRERLEPIIARLFRLGIPKSIIAYFWLSLYFGALALKSRSQLQGLFCVVCVTALTSFTMGYMPGVLFLDFRGRMLPVVVFANLTLLSVYTLLRALHALPEALLVFRVGVEYYSSLALGTGLIVGASPWRYMKKAALYMALFVAVAAAFQAAHVLTAVKVPGSILDVFFILVALEWLGHFGFRGGALVGCFVLGVVLFGGAKLLEKFGTDWLVFRL